MSARLRILGSAEDEGEGSAEVGGAASARRVERGSARVDALRCLKVLSSLRPGKTVSEQTTHLKAIMNAL